MPCPPVLLCLSRTTLAFRVASGLVLAVFVSPAQASFAQVAGQNINMVGGTQWPSGDPFLQRQNEPSLAVSSRNVLHLLAGANDYRTVDLPVSDSVPGTLAADAWLGIFKSFDGGQSWQSTLLPGYPQDTSPAGLASPLKAFGAAADPTVRAGTNGLFYYSGIAFNRGTNLGAVFVARFLDLNSKENGDATQSRDPVRYVNEVVIDTGTSGQFLDKPWIAVDIARSGAGTCTFNLSPTQSFPAGNVYLVWSRFTGSTSTKIMFSRSLDCGNTWSNPIKLSESNSINQGTNVAVDPVSGAVYVVWRRFATSSQSDAIVSVVSTDFGRTFTRAQDIATIIPFDQGTSPTSFRTNALPTLAVSVDGANVSRVHAAWAARPAAGADARIMLATSADGVNWGAPVAVDTTPLADDYGNSFSRGHQFMPQLTFTAGRLMLLYYDQRLDHTLGVFTPNNPFTGDALGRFYRVLRDHVGELLTNPASVFTLLIKDAGLTQRRHTIDLRVAEAVPGGTLAFTSSSVSQYRFGIRADLKDEAGQPLPQPIQSLRQLQVNAPNLPLFQQGTVPFLGDYIDIAGQTFLPPPTPGGPWRFNTATARAPVHYAVWTDNRDVSPPADGNWTHYTPVAGGGRSVLDPTQTTPGCVSGQEGMRNQNVYSSRITDGLLVSSAQDAKPLSATLTRAFVVTVQNFTRADRTFRFSIANQPAGGQASFLQGSFQATLDIAIAAHSGVARPVFATSSNPAASITVNVDETSGIGGALVSGGLAGSVVLNPEGSVTALTQPDGTTAPISSIEVYTPTLSTINISNPNPFINISNPNQDINISNINISNPDPGVINISNQTPVINISNINISNPDPAVINISNINISNTTTASINISNPNISNINISNAPVTDATYSVTNSGNTTHSYRVSLLGNGQPATPLQLIVSKSYAAPASVNCTLQQRLQNVVLANVNNPVVTTSLAQATDPAIPDSSLPNATMSLAPGESAFVTLRGNLDAAGMAQLTTQLTPVIVAHGANTGDTAPKFAAPLLVMTGSGTLPAAVVGTPYSAQLQAFGGTGTIVWSLASGSLPTGLTLSAAGQITGTPSAAGVFTFTARASDSGTPAQMATKSLSLTVNARATSTTLTFGSNPAVVGQASLATVTVTDIEAPGTKSSPAGAVTFGSSAAGDVFSPALTCTLAPSGAASASCSVTLTASSAGVRTVLASYSGSSVHKPSSTSAGLTVKGNTTTTILSDVPDPSGVGQPVTVSFRVLAVAPAVGTPAGTVTVSGGGVGASCSAPLASGLGSCSLTLSMAGTVTLTATYSGDANFNASSNTATHQVLAPYTFTGFLSPLATAGTFSSPSFSGTSNLGQAIPIKWRLQDTSGAFLSSLTTTSSLQAVFNSACAGAPAGTVILLYSPTSGATGGSTFRYDASSNQFIFNWDTSTGVPTGVGCYTIVLQPNDGSAAKATTVRLQ